MKVFGLNISLGLKRPPAGLPASTETPTVPHRHVVGLGRKPFEDGENLQKALAEGGGVPPRTPLGPMPQVDKDVAARMNRRVEG